MAIWKLWMLAAVSLLAKEGCSEFYFGDCSTGSMDVVENTDPLFMCGGYKARDLNWTVYDVKGEILYFGSCKEQTCGPMNNQFDLTAKKEHGSVYSSWLTIQKITRDSAYKLRCNTVFLTKECTLKIIVPVRIVPNSCRVNMLGWNVTGQCTLEWRNDQKMPNCTWHVLYQGKMQSFQGYTISDTHISTDYGRINCSFVRKMPVEAGNYTYSINVSSHPGDQFSKTFQIEKPDEPKHNCPETVLEGSNINCTCYVSKKGNPPAQIAWSGSNKENFVIKSVTRKSSGTFGFCHQTWGGSNKTAKYIVSISYGPSSTHIKSNREMSQKKTETVLTCTAIDVFPSAVFYWNITCEHKAENMNTSTCTLSTASEEKEMAVECTAINSIFHQVSSRSIYILNPKLTIDHNKKLATAASAQGGLIGGVVAVVVALAAIVAVAIACIIKRRKGAGKSRSERGVMGFSPDSRKHLHGTTPLSTLYAVVNKPKTDTPVESHSATSGDLYTIVCTTKANQDNEVYAVVCKSIWNKKNNKESDDYGQARDASREECKRKEELKPTLLPEPTIASKKRCQELSETSYVNVTEFITDSGLGVYHVVPCATNFGSSKPNTSVYFEAIVPDDEYNVLHFEMDRSGLEDQASHYSHLEQI